ncbi:MAG: nicotinate (nicotinamide) nucleotide adenylyltransferase [Bacteroidota bacterium]
MDKTVVGLFFGSFNPIHIGHLIIANYIVEFTLLKEIWFVVSPHNPLKGKTSLLPDHHRLALVNIAVEDDLRFKSCDIEFKLPKPSFTIHTLTYLKEKYPKKKFAIIMGADNLQSMDKWRNFEQIIYNYNVFVYPRPGSDGGKYNNHKSITWVDAPLMEISSSFIRGAIKEKKDIQYFLPPKVFKYISEMHFYEK